MRGQKILDLLHRAVDVVRLTLSMRLQSRFGDLLSLRVHTHMMRLIVLPYMAANNMACPLLLARSACESWSSESRLRDRLV